MLIKTAQGGYILGFMDEAYPEGVISLQYADDTLLFLSYEENSARCMKWMMIYFEKVPGKRINYHKSDLVPSNLEEEETQEYAKIFCCKIGKLLFIYLGVPLHHERLRREDIQPIVDKIMNRIAGWKGRFLSYGARLTLLKACLTSIPIYLMSIIKFPKWAIEAINSQMARFFWDDNEDKHMIHLFNIQSLYFKKEHGGLGIPDLRNLNMCLLSSWIQRYQDSENKLWREIIDSKYNTSSSNVFCSLDR
jgi:hypothetical protein